MDAKQIEDLAELSEETTRMLVSKMENGQSRERLQIEAKQIISSFINSYISLLERTKLNFKSTLAYLDSNTPYLLNQVSKLTDEHGSEFIDIIQQAFKAELQKNADILSEDEMSDEEKSELIARHSKEKDEEIEDQKNLEQKANTYSTMPRFSDILGDFTSDVSSQARRIADSHGYTYSTIEQRSEELKYETRRLIESISTRFNNSLHIHTDNMYSTYLEINEDYQKAAKTILSIGKDKVSKTVTSAPEVIPDPFTMTKEELEEYFRKVEEGQKQANEAKAAEPTQIEQDDKNPFDELFL